MEALQVYIENFVSLFVWFCCEVLLHPHVCGKLHVFQFIFSASIMKYKKNVATMNRTWIMNRMHRTVHYSVPLKNKKSHYLIIGLTSQ